MRHRTLTAFLLCLPLAGAPLGCGGDEDQAAGEDELDRQLDLALEADTGATTFEDTALVDTAEAPAPGPARQEQAPASPRTAPDRSREQSRTQPERAREPAPQPRTVTRRVPIGTTIAVRMNEELATDRTRAGDAFTARLEDPVVDADGTVLIPAGATVRGRVTAVAPSGRIGETAVMKLAFEAISFGGKSYPLQATVLRAEVRQKTRTSKTETAGKVAAGAAAGAILGQVLGKDTESTVKGAVIGAAAGTAIAMGTAEVDAVIAEDAEVVIRLDQPITMTRTVSG